MRGMAWKSVYLTSFSGDSDHNIGLKAGGPDCFSFCPALPMKGSSVENSRDERPVLPKKTKACSCLGKGLLT